MARVARHGLEDTPTIEEELRQFLLARTDHFLHELVSFARSPLSLESYDLQAVYEPPDAAMELDGTSSSSDGSSVIAISEGEEEAGPAGGRSDEAPAGSAYDNDDVVQSGGPLSLSVWDDETPGPSYSSAEPSCSLAGPLFGHAPQEATNEGRGGAAEEEEEEEECLIVGFKKPIAERTPELVQLSSDTEEEKKKEEETEELPPLPPSTLCYLPTIPPSTSGCYGGEREEDPKEREGEPRVRSLSGSSGGSDSSVLAVGPAPPGDERQGGEEAKDKRRKRRRIGRERSGTLHNPNRSLYPAMMRHYSSSPFHSSGLGSGSPPSPPSSTWEYHFSQVSPLSSSVSSHSRCSSSSSSPFGSSPPPAPSLSPSDRGEKPSGKRKYKSRHLDDKDPTWRPSSKEKRGGGRSRERQRRSVGERRSREDRSPSVEIVYEGTAPPPARKRRRKRQRRTQPSSLPVIITLDSDSSLGDDSSLISSQRTVDFSDLPPLPGPLPPADVLDRGSEVEPGGPVAVDNISDVDVEGSGSLLGSDDDVERPIGKRDTSSADVSSKRDSEVLSSDSCLLATILNDLEGMAVPPVIFDPGQLANAGAKCARDAPPLERLPNEAEDITPLERSNDEGEDISLLERPRQDVPPLLTQASPVRSYMRNTPPPLKHKDEGNTRLSPVDQHSLQASLDPLSVNSHIDLHRNPCIPPTESRPECCHLAPVDSRSTALPEVCNDAASHKPAVDAHSSCGLENRAESACFLHQESNSSKLHSPMKTSSPVCLHPVNSLPAIDFHRGRGAAGSLSSRSAGIRPTFPVR
uniref:RING-type E3 ubiquitin transferase n=1 Tax=Gasterosteus aculeatus aculeatus TaxID=481459 RepID=A0AAQ4S196_GASAC